MLVFLSYDSSQYLREIAEFSDEAVDVSLKQFEADLKYWSSSLSDDFKGMLLHVVQSS